MPRITTEKLNTFLRSEYKKRFFSVFFIGLAIIFFIHISLAISSYVLLTAYEKTYKNNDDTAQIELNEKRTYFISLVDETEKLSKLIIPNQSSSYISVFEKINEYGEGVEFNTFEIFFTSKESKVTIRGIAQTRQALIDFSDKMKNDESVKDFDIPFEVLTKQRDVPFDVTFTYYENK